MCLDEEELANQSQIIISENEPLCPFCCVNKSFCLAFVFYLTFLSHLLMSGFGV